MSERPQYRFRVGEISTPRAAREHYGWASEGIVKRSWTIIGVETREFSLRDPDGHYVTISALPAD